MTKNISFVTKSHFFRLQRICQIKRCLNEKRLQTLVQALVLSRLDYCNTILINLPDTTLYQITTILHSAARLVESLKPMDHINPDFRQLHWISIKARISFQICVLMFNIYSGFFPRYIFSLVIPCTKVESRSSPIRLPKTTTEPSARPTHLVDERLPLLSIRVEQSICLPPTCAIYRIIQKQSKNSSFSNLLRIIYSGHCALANVHRFRIKLVLTIGALKR